MAVGTYLTMGERMGGGNAAKIYELPHRQPPARDPLLPVESPPPVLLPLPRIDREPAALPLFTQKGCEDCSLVCKKPTPVVHRAHRVDRVAVGTTPALQRNPLRNHVEVAIYISVPPKPVTFAGRTTARPWPLKGFSVRQDFTTIDRQIQYQGADPWYWI